jgi:hypothetical protein
VYQKNLGRTDYLDSLGPLIKPTRGSRSDVALSSPERVAEASDASFPLASAADAGIALSGAEQMFQPCLSG